MPEVLTIDVSSGGETALHRVHQSVGTAMLKKGMHTIPPTLSFPLDDRSFLYKAMPVLVPSALGATAQENLEVQLKVLMSALNSVSASLPVQKWF